MNVTWRRHAQSDELPWAEPLDMNSLYPRVPLFSVQPIDD